MLLRWLESLRHLDSLSLKRLELRLERLVRAVFPQRRRQDEAVVLVQRDKMPVKRRMVCCGEAKPVFGIETISRIL